MRRELTGEQISLSRSLDVLILDVISVLGEHSRDVVLDLIDSTNRLLIPGGELADIGDGSTHITCGANNSFSSQSTCADNGADWLQRLRDGLVDSFGVELSVGLGLSLSIKAEFERSCNVSIGFGMGSSFHACLRKFGRFRDLLEVDGAGGDSKGCSNKGDSHGRKIWTEI